MTDQSNHNPALPPVSLVVTQERLNAYANASGDYNPLHWDAAFAADTQFGGVIAHGMLTLALISRMMTIAYGKDWLTGGSLRVRFKGAARLGDVVASQGAVSREEAEGGRRRLTCSVAVVNHNGEELVAGIATVRVAADSAAGS